MTTKMHDAMNSLLSAVQAADSILLFSHVSPDGDTLGSALALKMLLQRQKKQVALVLDGVVPEHLFFLPDLYAFRSPEAVWEETEGKSFLAIAVDVASLERLGCGKALFEKAAVTAQIDHHHSNPGYAEINLIDGDAPATAVIIDRVRDAMGLPLEREETVCLYTALATDTGNFVYESINSEAFLLMSRLMEAGLPLAKYSQLLFRRKERDFLVSLGKALPTLTYFCKGQVAGMQLRRDKLKDGESANTEGIVNYAIDAAGVKLAYFLYETEAGDIKCNLRALSPFRVDEVAALFGGGGHYLAAGCTLEGSLEDAVKKVQEALQKAWEETVHG